MSDDAHMSKSGRFVKGVHRASFTPVEPGDIPMSPAKEESVPPISSGEPRVYPSSPVSFVPQSASPRPKKRSPKTLIFFLLFALLGSLAALTFQLYWQSHQTLAKLEQAAPQVLMDLQTKEIVDRVRKHMVLPDEEPLVNTVTNADEVRGEPFYANAQNGDKVIVFSTRAILYSPALDKIVEVGFIRQISPTPFAEGSASSGQGGEASPAPEVAGDSTPSGHILLQVEKK
jgi:hypothetical protein